MGQNNKLNWRTKCWVWQGGFKMIHKTKWSTIDFPQLTISVSLSSHLLLLFLLRNLQGRWVGEGGGLTVRAVLHLGHLNRKIKRGPLFDRCLLTWTNLKKTGHDRCQIHLRRDRPLTSFKKSLFKSSISLQLFGALQWNFIKTQYVHFGDPFLVCVRPTFVVWREMSKLGWWTWFIPAKHGDVK